MREPDRISSIEPQTFVQNYIEANKVAIIEDAIQDWELSKLWSPEYLAQKYGEDLVQVYNDYFDLEDICPLQKYLNNHFGKNDVDGSVPYVRWYTKFKAVDFIWADDFFKKFSHQWGMPGFLPDSGYLLPFCPQTKTLNPAIDFFPAKGAFISPKGGKTRLHFDPWASDAVLFQIYGEKTWTMFDPGLAPQLVKDGKCVDIENPDPVLFPDYKAVEPTYKFSTRPGETVYVPRGWLHHVDSITDSISLTFNFVHECSQDHFLEYLDQSPQGNDLEILQFFFSEYFSQTPGAEDIKNFVRNHIHAETG